MLDEPEPEAMAELELEVEPSPGSREEGPGMFIGVEEGKMEDDGPEEDEEGRWEGRWELGPPTALLLEDDEVVLVR